MVPNSALMKSVEALDYRVTTGDVASQAGLDIKVAEQGLLALASEAGGHLQVAESGDVVYLFPRNFRAILRSKSLQLRLQELWQRIWNVLFYIIRISFGILLIASLVIIAVAITALFVVYSSQQRDDGGGRSDRGGSNIVIPFFVRGMMFDLFRMDYYGRRYRRSPYGRTPTSNRPASRNTDENQLNFLEAVFSFLFGDGNPNADLDDRRWQQIALVIRNNKGAVAAEQVAPYLDINDSQLEDEDYMLPVLLRFNGRPEVSPQGNIIYHFPELQVMAEKYGKQSVPQYLKEREWPFSLASSAQLTWAGGLGAANLIGAGILGSLLVSPEWAGTSLQLGGTIGWVDIGYGILLLYAIAFVATPLIRYIWLKGKNRTIEKRNQVRLRQSNRLDHPSEELEEKVSYAQTFASETIVSAEDLAYTTESDLTEQEASNSDRIDEEWRRRLEGLY